MNDISQINALSWELATLAIFKANDELKAYSKVQIRKIMSAALSADKSVQLQKLRDEYDPAPPQGSKPDHQSRREINRKRELNKKFVNRVLEIIKDKDNLFIQQLFQYTLWNIKILEDKKANQNADKIMKKLKLLLDCEGIDKENILETVEQTLKPGQDPRNSYGKRARNSKKSNGRY